MGRWTQHLEALTSAISGMRTTAPVSAEGADDENDAVSLAEQVGADAESSASPEEVSEPSTSEVTDTEQDGNAIERALVQGMEVALGDLEQTEHGWLYRGNPVMVFAVDVAAVDDREIRREFFHRVHLASCCGALEDSGQPVWIGTAREALAAPGLAQAPHACEYCLTKVNHRGFRSLGPRDRSRVAAAFSFHWHVSQYAAEYFSSEQANFWAPGKKSQALQQFVPETTVDGGICGHCEWTVPEGEGWFVPVERGMELGLSIDACVLCAQQQAMGVLTLPEDLALQASRARCDEVRRIARAGIDSDDAESKSEEIADSERDWQWVRRQLPLAWHPLCEQLERKLSPPVLFHRFTGYEGVAVLAWPEHRRGIVADESEREQLPEGWDFWSMRSVLGSLG